jgi:CDP-diacylglycerol--glycerol-3-phosphate 3-phosphatidyltransferase
MQVKTKDFFLLPNILSWSRILIAILVAWLLKIDTDIGNLWLIVAALVGVATDMLDGYFSRKMNQVTELGIVLDPICDKIGMAIVMIALIVFRGFPLPIVVFLLYRDVLIMIAGFFGIKKTNKPVMANYFGKLNTGVISIGVILFMFGYAGILYEIFMIAGYFLIFISGFSYMLVGEKLLFNKYSHKIIFRTALILLSAAVVYSMKNFTFI